MRKGRQRQGVTAALAAPMVAGPALRGSWSSAGFCSPACTDLRPARDGWERASIPVSRSEFKPARDEASAQAADVPVIDGASSTAGSVPLLDKIYFEAAAIDKYSREARSLTEKALMAERVAGEAAAVPREWEGGACVWLEHSDADICLFGVQHAHAEVQSECFLA